MTNSQETEVRIRTTIPGPNTRVMAVTASGETDLGQCIALTATNRKVETGSKIDDACPCWLDFLYVMKTGVEDEQKTRDVATDDCRQRRVEPMWKRDKASVKQDLYVSSSEAGGTASILVVDGNGEVRPIKVKHTLVIKDEDTDLAEQIERANPNLGVIVAKTILVWEGDINPEREGDFLAAVDRCINHTGPCFKSSN